MQQRLSIITLGVSDLEKSLKFYKDGLGWQPSPKSQESIVFFNMGGIILSLYPKELLAEDAKMEPANGSSVFTLAHNTFSEAEVDETIEKVRALGAKIIKEPQKVFWGGYSSYFQDPDGYYWEVAFNPFAEFDENGTLML